MAQPQTLVEGYRAASARLHGAQSQNLVFENTRDQHGKGYLASRCLYTGLMVAALVEGANGRHVPHPNMDDSPESGEGLEVQAAERVQSLKENVQIGEHVRSNVTPLEGAAYRWPEDLSMKVRGSIICILYHSLHYI